ncbi:hypothetical protein [Kribbella swartbergensis]
MNNLNDTLPDLMRRATENLEPESTDLVERGMRRGAALRRRRTLLRSATGATAALATAAVVVTGTQLFGNDAQQQPPTAGAAATTASTTVKAPVTQKETLQTLVELLPPHLKVKTTDTWGDPGFNGAAVVVDDGKGAAKLSLGVSGPGLDGTCHQPEPGTCTSRPDGSKITVRANEPTYGQGNPGGVLSNSVTVNRADGTAISLISFNAPEEKGVEHSRPAPVLSVAELTKIVDSKLWRFPPKQPIPTTGPSKPDLKSPGAGKPAVPVQQTLQTLKKVLPKNLQVTSPETWGGGSNGYNGAAFVVNDGKGLSRIDAFVTIEAPVTKCPAEAATTSCTVRSDGSVVSWTKEAPEYTDARQAAEGVVSNLVQIRYPDGRSISMTSYNGPQQKGAKHTRPKPAFSVDQLLTMAGSKSWKFPGTGK